MLKYWVHGHEIRTNFTGNTRCQNVYTVWSRTCPHVTSVESLVNNGNEHQGYFYLAASNNRTFTYRGSGASLEDCGLFPNEVDCVGRKAEAALESAQTVPARVVETHHSRATAVRPRVALLSLPQTLFNLQEESQVKEGTLECRWWFG